MIAINLDAHVMSMHFSLNISFEPRFNRIPGGYEFLMQNCQYDIWLGPTLF
jgi:hypothetical protein